MRKNVKLCTVSVNYKCLRGHYFSRKAIPNVGGGSGSIKSDI